jgi:hypothetical protein
MFVLYYFITGQSLMAYELKIIEKTGYLHFVITGQNTKDNIVQYVDHINRECTARNYFMILIEERLDGPRLSIMDLFEIIQDITNRARGIFKAIAYVDINAEGDSMKFAEDACVNRALPLAIFPTVREAEEWLVNKVKDYNK